MPVSSIAPAELSAWLSDPARSRPLLLDVREPWEFQTAQLKGSTLLPLRELPARFGELDANAETVVICHHGGRSLQAALFLERQGFARLHNLAGAGERLARTVGAS